MKDFNDKSRPPPDHEKALVKLIDGMAYRHDKWQVFSDFVEMGAISMSNAVDLVHRDKSEERYMQIVQRYKPDELALFPQMLGELVMALETETDDVLGRVFHDLELHNKYTGQFFSPYPLCRIMAKVTLGNKAEIEARIAENGFIRAVEPAAGFGAMVLALAQEMRDLGINYQKHLHVTAVDVDRHRALQFPVTGRIRPLAHTRAYPAWLGLQTPTAPERAYPCRDIRAGGAGRGD